MHSASFEFPSRLYPIVDTIGGTGHSHAEIAEAMLRGGARFLQLRIKDRTTAEFVEVAREVKGMADRAGAVLVINDRADIAKLIDAAGVHLGQEDLPVRAARAMLGSGKLIGLSTHSIEQVESASRSSGADYIGFGPIFPTASKDNPDPVQGLKGLRAARRCSRLPIVAIGGITERTMPSVLSTGADAVAMIGEIVGASDIEAKIRGLLAF